MGVLYSMYDALVSINVPNDKARAVVDAMEQEMLAQLVTRNEFAAEMKLVRQEFASMGQGFASRCDLLSKDIQSVTGRIDNQTREMTIRFGGMLVATVVLVSALIAIFKALF